MLSDAYTEVLVLIIGNIRESHFLCKIFPTSKLLKPNPTDHGDFEDVNHTTLMETDQVTGQTLVSSLRLPLTDIIL